MGTFAPITLTDTVPSPDVDYVFNPHDITGNVATFEAANTDGVPIGAARLSASVVRTASGRNKVVIKLSIPVVQDVVVSGVTKPSVIRTLYWNIEVTSDATSSTGERYGSLTMVKDLLTEQSIQDLISLLTPYY